MTAAWPWAAADVCAALLDAVSSARLESFSANADVLVIAGRVNLDPPRGVDDVSPRVGRVISSAISPQDTVEQLRRALGALLDVAVVSSDAATRRTRPVEAQAMLARPQAYIGLWRMTNLAIARRGLTGIRLTAAALTFREDVARQRHAAAN